MTQPSVGILLLKNKSVLLVKHEEGSGFTEHIFGLPSGRLKNNEPAIHAAVRELQEETGLQTQVEDLIEFPGNFYTAKLPNRKNLEEQKMEYTWRVFLCTKYIGEIKPSTETTPEWVEIENLDKYNLIVNVRNAIEAGLHFKELKERNIQ